MPTPSWSASLSSSRSIHSVFESRCLSSIDSASSMCRQRSFDGAEYSSQSSS
jgi:hypothetical protein